MLLILKSFWKIAALFNTDDKKEINAELVRIDGKEFSFLMKMKLNEIVEKVKNSDFSFSAVTKKKVKRTPPPPFITSTLLQESVKKLNFFQRKP